MQFGEIPTFRKNRLKAMVINSPYACTDVSSVRGVPARWGVWYCSMNLGYNINTGLLRLLRTFPNSGTGAVTSICQSTTSINNKGKTISIPERHCEVVALDNRSNLGFALRVCLDCFVPFYNINYQYTWTASYLAVTSKENTTSNKK
jgi:hypothetical protein